MKVGQLIGRESEREREREAKKRKPEEQRRDTGKRTEKQKRERERGNKQRKTNEERNERQRERERKRAQRTARAPLPFRLKPSLELAARRTPCARGGLRRKKARARKAKPLGGVVFLALLSFSLRALPDVL